MTTKHKKYAACNKNSDIKFFMIVHVYKKYFFFLFKGTGRVPDLVPTLHKFGNMKSNEIKVYYAY